jgi:flagellar basal-body rod protein FlgB
MLEQVLNYHNQRHDIIATNVANANTPGYSAFDVVLDHQAGGAKSLEMKQTHAGHLSADGTLEKAAGQLERSRDPARLDGNNVSLDKEFMKLTENRVMYQVAFELFDRWGDLSRVAREIR